MKPRRIALGSRAAAARDLQRGVVMWVALIVLIVMTLAGLAMMRQMGTGISIAGNIAFKQNATSTADSGTEAARAWIVLMGQTTPAVLFADAPALGYNATWGASVDPTTFNWDTASVAVALDAATGNDVRYVIHRLCQSTGPASAATQVCSDIASDNGRSREGGSYAPGSVQSPVFQPYYRVTARVLGPRNTVSYTQVILQ